MKNLMLLMLCAGVILSGLVGVGYAERPEEMIRAYNEAYNAVEKFGGSNAAKEFRDELTNILEKEKNFSAKERDSIREAIVARDEGRERLVEKPTPDYVKPSNIGIEEKAITLRRVASPVSAAREEPVVAESPKAEKPTGEATGASELNPNTGGEAQTPAPKGGNPKK
ncbi:MAG: hypothetical protein PHT41_05005 [Candidatus Omnitrophica bacterium]|nr:hypothetical protein [Candidatus Omnitrophota bacterium]MDD5237715.1 hypothetical protein [Candidatus Omnitrophota bacterium]